MAQNKHTKFVGFLYANNELTKKKYQENAIYHSLKQSTRKKKTN